MNPYSPPSSSAESPYGQGFGYGPPPAAPPAAPGAGVTEASVEFLRQTRPWVMVVAVVLAILSAFMLLGGLSIVAIGMLMPKSGMGGIGAAEALLMGAIYIPLAALYVYPTIKLWQYAGAIGRLLGSRSSADLEAALLRQKSFWKFSGIAMLVVIGVYVLVFVGAIGMGMMAAMSR